MSEIKEFLNNKKENEMIFKVYTLDSEPQERIFKNFDEITEYTGIKNAKHFIEEGGVSSDGIIRLEAANDYTKQFLKEESVISRFKYENGEFNPNLLANFNQILEKSSPISERDFILLDQNLKSKIEKENSTIFMVSNNEEIFTNFLEVDNLQELNNINHMSEKQGGKALGSYHYEDTLSIYDYSKKKLFVIDLRGESESIDDILKRDKVKGVNKLGAMEYDFHNEETREGYTKTQKTLVFGTNEEVDKVFTSFENKIEEVSKLINSGELDDTGMYYYTEKDGFNNSKENPIYIEDAAHLFDEREVYTLKGQDFELMFFYAAEVTDDILINAGSQNDNLYIEGTNGEVVEFKLGDKVELNENPKIFKGLEKDSDFEFNRIERLSDPKQTLSKKTKMKM